MEFFEVKFEDSYIAKAAKQLAVNAEEFTDTKHRFSCQPGGCHRNGK